MPRHAMTAMAAAAAVVMTLPEARAGKLARGMDLCSSYSRVCSDITSQVDCRSHFDGQTPKPMLTMQSCEAGSYDTYLGHCKCAALDASTLVLQELVDYSITPALPLLVQPSKTVNGSVDYGASYEKACTTFLSGSKCPSSLQIVAGYGAKGGFADFKGDCICGTIDASDSVRETLNAFLLTKKLGATSATLPTTNAADNSTTAAAGIDVCSTFDAACATFLEDIACPAALQANKGCATPNAPETLAGSCRCGAMDASGSVKTALLGLALPGAAVEAAKVQVAASSAVGSAAAAAEPMVEFCRTYENTCGAFLTAAGIGPELHEARSNCVGGNGTNLATFRGECAAGSLDMSAAVTSFLVSKSVEADVDDLVCLDGECAPFHLNPGTMAIAIISGVLSGLALLLYLCQRCKACMANNPLLTRLLAPCACLFRRPRGDKESPQLTDHEMQLKGMMA